MNIIDPILGEFEHEAVLTRKMLERVPSEHLDWKPHEKSMTLGALSSHIVEALDWLGAIVNEDDFTLDMESYDPYAAKDTADLLATYDKNVAAAKELLAGLSDEKMMATWTMRVGGNVVMQLPRVAVIRNFTSTHNAHHRGQLSVYLRLKDVPLPQIYGPTADEPNF